MLHEYLLGTDAFKEEKKKQNRSNYPQYQYRVPRFWVKPIDERIVMPKIVKLKFLYVYSHPWKDVDCDIIEGNFKGHLPKSASYAAVIRDFALWLENDESFMRYYKKIIFETIFDIHILKGSGDYQNNLNSLIQMYVNDDTLFEKIIKPKYLDIE